MSNSKGAKKPACFTGNCPISEIAPDIDLNNLVDAFLKARRLAEFPSLQNKILTDSGLYEEPDLIVACETVIERVHADKRKQQEAKRRGQELAQKQNGLRHR